MKAVALLDTGPLVSFLGSGLQHHEWAIEEWKRLRPPLLTCEPVLTEAAFLLKREGCDTDALFALLDRGIVRIAFSIREQWGGPSSAHAALPEPADVARRRLHRQAF
jgi:predicted nucleic acid-binding protein